MDENEEERSIGKRAIRNWNKMRLKGKVVEKIRKKEKRNKRKWKEREGDGFERRLHSIEIPSFQSP